MLRSCWNRCGDQIAFGVFSCRTITEADRWPKLLLHVAKEQYRLASEALYEYVLANTDVRLEKPQLQVARRTIEKHDYPSA